MRRAYLGIAGGPRPLPPRARAALGVRSGRGGRRGGATAARPTAPGLRAEDLIVEVDGTPTASVDDLQRLRSPIWIGS